MIGRGIAELHDLSGRVALVTGAAGFGFAGQIVEALAEAGARVMLTSRDAEKAEASATEFRERGFEVEGVVLELNDEATMVDAVERTVERFGGLDILVNAAAAIRMESVEAVALEAFNATLNANVGGTLAVSRAAAPHLRAGGRGTIINLSSIYGVVAPAPRIYGDSGLNSPLVYGASKAAIEQMTRYLAIHWAPEIRVNCVAPGGLYNNQDDVFVERYTYRTPLDRMGKADDIKGIALYLASDASAWVTGQNFMVDGGWTAW